MKEKDKLFPHRYMRKISRKAANKSNNKPRQNKIIRFFKFIYIKLFRINDTPQRISLGFGIGVFLGIIPLSGPIAALFLAWLFRLNRISALLGSLLTNTWLSIATFLIATKIGSSIMKLDWQDTYNNWKLILKNFHWFYLFKLSFLKIIFPLFIGYFIVAFIIGFMVYLITLMAILTYQKNKTVIVKLENKTPKKYSLL